MCVGAEERERYMHMRRYRERVKESENKLIVIAYMKAENAQKSSVSQINGSP